MGSKRFDCLWDFVRHGFDLELSCRNPHCHHVGIVDAHEACAWFRLHRWSDVIEGFGASSLDHFYCTKCRARAGRVKPTRCPPTMTNFFPSDEQGWKRLQRKLRG